MSGRRIFLDAFGNAVQKGDTVVTVSRGALRPANVLGITDIGTLWIEWKEPGSLSDRTRLFAHVRRNDRVVVVGTGDSRALSIPL